MCVLACFQSGRSQSGISSSQKLFLELEQRKGIKSKQWSGYGELHISQPLSNSFGFIQWMRRKSKLWSETYHPTRHPVWTKSQHASSKTVYPSYFQLLPPSLMALLAPTSLHVHGLKSGDPEESGNNHPISLLPVLSKIAETLAHKQFVDYLTISKKLSIYQSGNRKLHSTETALLHVTDELLKAMDDKKASILVLLDMSKVSLRFWGLTS